MSNNYKKTQLVRESRKRRTRLKLRRISDRPRLVVSRSSNHIYAQIVNDLQSQTIVSASTMQKEFKGLDEKLRGINAAKWVGKRIAELALEQGVKQVVFDTGQYLYHGRVKALAESAREAGLDF